MLKYAPLAVSLVTLASIPMACGGSSGDSQVNGAGPNGSSGSTGSINVPGSGGGGSISGTHTGGTMVLTPAQVKAITSAACTGWTSEGENLPAALDLVIDTSGSMNDMAPGGQGSKWVVTRGALQSAVAGLPATVSLGALYFPNENATTSATARDVSACVNTKTMLPMAVLGAAGSAVRTAFDASLQAIRPQSYTPTHDAYKYALTNGLEPYMTTSNKFMLLITDGAPTMSLGCITGAAPRGMRGGGGITDQPTAPIIAEVAAAKAKGIRTFVIGSPGSEMSSQGGMDMRPWLSAAATAGGTATAGCSDMGPNFCHLDMTQAPDFGAALTAGLSAIVGQVVDACTFTLPTPPAGQMIDPNLTNLIITAADGSSKLVLPSNTGTCTEGWTLNGSGQVVLCPTTCSEVKGNSAAHVQLVFGCESGVVPPVK